MKEALVYLAHIIESAEKIQEYINNITKKEFLKSSEKQDCVIRRFEIIGEATKHLTDDTKRRDKHIPWKKITGMRDILIHEYFAIDVHFVWKTAKYDLPKLLNRIKIVVELTKSNK